jgi:hypothetical protein
LIGWNITDLLDSQPMVPTREEHGLVVYSWQTVALDRMVYWAAPIEYRGNKVASYGGILEYAFYYNIADGLSDGECDASNIVCEGYLANRDVILEGNGMYICHLPHNTPLTLLPP